MIVYLDTMQRKVCVFIDDTSLTAQKLTETIVTLDCPLGFTARLANSRSYRIPESFMME
jgi:hypothetical protein